MLRRQPVRVLLSTGGLAVAVFLLCAERAVHDAVREATGRNERETRLVVFRENRFCPFTSRLPERYADAIAGIDGVARVMPVQVTVSNCRASLDVVVFRGVRTEDAIGPLASRLGAGSEELVLLASRGDAAIVGRTLAERRGLRVGDRFTAAGITTTIVGIVDATEGQDRNTVFVELGFLQRASGGVQGGEVTQFEVEVARPELLGRVAEAIDRRFATDAAPTSTRAAREFTARAARDLVAVAGFAGWLGAGALVAVFALVANAIVLSLEGRVREIAVLRAIGFGAPSIAAMIVSEAAVLALVGGGAGAAACLALLEFGTLGLGAEGVYIEFEPSAATAAGAVGAAVLTAIAAATAPAIATTRRPIVEAIRA
jgi:putative ABC transport system permease protein